MMSVFFFIERPSNFVEQTVVICKKTSLKKSIEFGMPFEVERNSQQKNVSRY